MDKRELVTKLSKMRIVANKALRGDSNDAEHDALYEIKEDLTKLIKTLKAGREILIFDEGLDNLHSSGLLDTLH